MKIEGTNNKNVMLWEIEDGETFTFPNNMREVYIKTTSCDEQPDLTKWYRCVSLVTGDICKFSERGEVVKCKAKVVVE